MVVVFLVVVVLGVRVVVPSSVEVLDSSVLVVVEVVVTVPAGGKGLTAFTQFNPSFEFVSSESLTKPVGILSVPPSSKISVTFT